MSEKDILKDARQKYADAEDGWSEVKMQYLDDYRFARLGEQWPVDILQRRRTAGRPALTINRMPPFIRQVVNDGRKNRPGISVRPADGGADVQTADILGGLIRNIEAVSKADIAYDIALENACSGGFGFVHLDFQYACDDTFDLDLSINAIPNPLAVLWDPLTEVTDSSDWDYAFISEEMTKDAFEVEFPGRKSEASNFEGDAHISTWFEKDMVRIARYYERTKVPRKILMLMSPMSDQPIVVDAEKYADPETRAMYDVNGFTVSRERAVESYLITHRLITATDVLDEKSWRASSIPIVPCYGEELNVEGRRYFRSMIHDAIDAQRVHNYSRSTATEVVSLAPRIPFLGKKGQFDADPEKWENINTENWPYIEYNGEVAPSRPAFSGIPDGALNEANAALEDMKFIIGVSNPSLGMPDTRVISGKAKRMEREESDTSTFHLLDNQNRMIRAVGQCALEMIPTVYSGPRIVRILGMDGKASNVPINQKIAETGRVFDITTGKYDVVLEAGPSYSTRREEAAEMITSFISAAPQTAPILGPMLAKMSDWPEAEKVSQLLATQMPPDARAIFDGTPPPPPQPPPEVLAEQAKAQADMQIAQQKAQNDFTLEQQRSQNKVEIERIQASADIEVMRMKAGAEIELMKQKAIVELELKREEARISAEIRAMTAANQNAQKSQAVNQ